MKKRSESEEAPPSLRDKIVGLGERSIRKSYFPQLQQQLEEVEKSRIYLEEKSAALLNMLEDLEEGRKKLAASEAQLRAIVETTPDCIMLIAADGTLLEVNEAGLKMLECESAEVVIGQRLDSMIAPEFQEAFRSFNGSVFQGNQGIFQFEIIGLKGTRRWLETHAVPLRNPSDGTPIQLAVTRDITERKLAEEEIRRLNQDLEQRVIDRTAELARAHEHLRAILDTAGEGVVFTDPQGTIEYINPAMERLTGYLAAETIGRNPRVWKGHQTPVATYQQMWSALTRGEIWQGELVNRHKDGRLYDAALTAAPLTNPDGQTVGFVGVQRDITRQKELDRMKDQFVSNVSHELRTPLANVLLHIGLLEQGKPDKRDVYLRTLRREAERLRKMIEDLLDLSRLDRNVVPIQLVSIDLQQLLEQLLTDRVALAEQRGLTLTYEPTFDLPLVLTDAAQLIQVGSNLLTNALNYTPAGGVVSVWAEVRRHGGQKMVAFTVRDTGPGIAAQDMPHLFERFYRGAAGRQASAPGTGLGLAISQEIMERLGGRITIESEAGHGAAFTVWLPIA